MENTNIEYEINDDNGTIDSESDDSSVEYNLNNRDDIVNYFNDTCSDGNFDEFKECIDKLNVLEFINDEYLEKCLDNLLVYKRYKSLHYLIPNKLNIDRLSVRNIRKALACNILFLIKLKCKTFDNINKTNSSNITFDQFIDQVSCNNISFTYKFFELLHKNELKDVFYKSKTDEEIIKIWKFRRSFYINCVNFSKESIKEDLLNTYINEITLDIRKYILTSLIEKKFLSKTITFKLKEMIDYKFFCDIETDNFYIINFFTYKHLDFLHYIIEKGANLEKAIADEKDSNLKQLLINFRNEHYPLPDVKVAK